MKVHVRDKDDDDRPLPRPHNAGKKCKGQGRAGRVQGSRRITSRALGTHFIYLFLTFTKIIIYTCATNRHHRDRLVQWFEKG